MSLALDKKVNFLPCGWVSGLVMSVSVPMADVSETRGTKKGNDVDRRSCYLSWSISFYIHVSWGRLTVQGCFHLAPSSFTFRHTDEGKILSIFQVETLKK